jgi:ferrochelatase
MQKLCFGCKPSQDKIGILIAQLGTPDAPTKKALRPYLKQFLSDPRVIEVNRFLWWFILNGIVLNTRPKRSARLYERVWTKEGSPLLTITNSLTKKLQSKFSNYNGNVEVDFGMRYGKPSLESAIDNLISKGCTRLLLFPMYPHYSGPTTASTYDAVFSHLLKRRYVPTLKVAEPYYRNTKYIDVQAKIINDNLEKMAEKPEYLIISFHGIPLSYVRKGDPYCCMCTETKEALVRKLNFPKDRIIQTYQSRFGKDPWLTPYADETVIELAKKSVKNIAIAAPGFTTDCLETIDELGTEAEHIFKENGGKKLTLIPCLNDHDLWIEAMKDIITAELGSWLDFNSQYFPPQKISCPLI